MCRIAVEVTTEVSRSLLTLVHIVYLFFLSLSSTVKLESFMFRFERGMKPLPNKFELNIIISI
jgi:hypothetical protein